MKKILAILIVCTLIASITGIASGADIISQTKETFGDIEREVTVYSDGSVAIKNTVQTSWLTKFFSFLGLGGQGFEYWCSPSFLEHQGQTVGYDHEGYLGHLGDCAVVDKYFGSQYVRAWGMGPSDYKMISVWGEYFDMVDAEWALISQGLMEPPLPALTTRSSPCGNYGDVNDDGEISATDIILVEDHLRGVSTLTSNQADRADVDGVEGITALDAILITEYYAEGRDSFPICTMATPAPPPIPIYTLSVLIDGIGSVQVTPPNAVFVSDITWQYEEGTEVTLTAITTPPSIFGRWEVTEYGFTGIPLGSPSDYITESISVLMDGDIMTRVVFIPPPTPTSIPTQTPTPTSTPTSTPSPTPFDPGDYSTPGFEVVFAILGLLAVAYLVLTRREDK